MFRKGGSVNEGIMHGLEDRSGYAGGGTIGGGNIQGTPMGYRTGFQDPTWDSMTPTDWENIAKTYGMSGAVSTDYTDAENIEKWSQPIDYDFFNWLSSNKVKAKAEEVKQKQIKALQNINAAKLEGIKTGGEQLPPWKEQGFESYADWLAVQGSGKGTGTIDDISVSDLNKERMKIFAPGMQKRMINDALAAASEAFGTSTGDTKQDIANAISAAAKGMGGTKDLYDKISMMTLSGEIQKDIAKETYKPNSTQSMIDFYRNTGMSDKDIVKQLSKDTLNISDFMRTANTTKGAYKAHAHYQHSDDPKWGGSLPEDKKGLVDGEKAKEIMEEGKFYFDQDKLIYVQLVTEDGEKKIKKFVPK